VIRATIGLDPDQHPLRFVAITEMISDQRVQPGDPDDPLRQPATGQPSTGLVHDLDVVMGLGPVITDEQHCGLPRSDLAR